MKALIFFLVLLNVGYGGWQLVFGDLQPPQTALGRITSPELKGVPELELLASELTSDVVSVDDGIVVNDSQTEQDPVTADIASAADAQCWLLGPFDEKSAAKALQVRLQANGVGVDISKLATPVAPDYWVYIEPQASRRAAVALLRELQARQIDSFIVSEGELENAISLGIFSKENSAKRILAKHQEQEYPVMMTTIPRQVEEFWGVLTIGEHAKLAESRWGTLKEQGDGFTMKQNFCDVVASTSILE